MMRSKFRGLLLFVFAITSQQVLAQSYAPKPYSSKIVGGWTIAPAVDEDGTCLMFIDYQGRYPTRLALFIDSSGLSSLMLSNDGWTIRPEEIYKLDYQLSVGSYSNHPTIGLKGGSLITRFEKSFPDHFAKSDYLNIYRDDVVVERLSLKGSSAAVAEVKRCVAHIQREAEAINRDRRKFEDIPSNPFSDR